MAGDPSNFSLSHTPFKAETAGPSVFVASGSGAYDNTRKALANIDLSPAKGKRVLLKPNIGRDTQPEKGVTTHPQVVAAAIDAFKDAGAIVAIGESPIAGVKMLDAFKSGKITSIAQERNCPLIDMDIRPHIPVNIPAGVAIKSLKLCADVTEYDIIVSIPVMKTHMHTGVTLSVKNMKGCLWRRSKVELHMLGKLPEYEEKPLDIAIADMASVLRPHLAIIDGTIAMEGLGPGAGTPKPLDAIVVAADPFAADAIACELMGIPASDVPHLRMAAERGYGVIDLDKIKVSPDNWKDFISPFVLPPKNLSIEFEGFNVLDSQSCSACQSTLLLLLRDNGSDLLAKRPNDKDITIAIGKGHKDLPPGTLCVGNCTAKHKKRGIFVPGCPPVASEIVKAYFEYQTGKNT